jgi:hypothetical protein
MTRIPSFLLLGLLVVSAGGCSMGPDATESLAIFDAPSGAFQVHIAGDFNPSTSISKKPVTAAIVRRSGSRTAPFVIHEADFFDTGFDRRYPHRLWSADDTLRLSFHDSVPVKGSSWIELHNSGSRPLDLLRLEAEDLLLVVDMAPGAHRRIQMPAPRGDDDCLEVTRYSRGGRVVTRYSGCFRRPAGVSAITKVVVSDVGVEIAQTPIED